MNAELKKLLSMPTGQQGSEYYYNSAQMMACFALGRRAGMTESAGICTSKIEEVQKRLDAGKGEWPKEGYVRDETWHSWQGEGFALRCAAAAIEKARNA